MKIFCGFVILFVFAKEMNGDSSTPMTTTLADVIREVNDLKSEYTRLNRVLQQHIQSNVMVFDAINKNHDDLKSDVDKKLKSLKSTITGLSSDVSQCLSSCKNNQTSSTTKPTQAPEPDTIDQCQAQPGPPGVDECSKLVNSSDPKSCFLIEDKRGFKVLCDPFTDGGGWTFLQRRKNGSVDFYQDWDSYANGFGDLDGDFWLGLEKIHKLSNSSTWEVRVDMTAPKIETLLGRRTRHRNVTKAFAQYGVFSVGDLDSNFTLTLQNYSGTAGDSWLNKRYKYAINDGMQFTTLDVDNDLSYMNNCANISDSGFWFRECTMGNINGRWIHAQHTGDHVSWYTFCNSCHLVYVDMKIRPIN